MIPRPITRSPGTRTARVDTRQRALESLAAEFALLAQRRARVVHQIELLDQQRDAAANGFAKLQSRMSWLAHKMDALDPELRDGQLEMAPEPEPEPELPPMRPLRAAAKPAPVEKAPPPPLAGRRQFAARPSLQSRPSAGKWRT